MRERPDEHEATGDSQQPPRRRGTGVIAPIVAALSVIAATFVIGTSIAPADVPPTPIAAPFDAPRCPGTTNSDPANRPGTEPVPNLLSVFGQRLDDYNDGLPVMLYESSGSNDGAYPPLCVTRYVDGIGAVSEWMFCTDIYSAVCGETTAAGELAEGATALDPLTRLAGNVRLTSDQETTIAILLQRGPAAYDGDGYYSWGGVTEARSDGTSAQRWAMQTLVWCISDPPSFGSEPERFQTCQDSMDSAEQARLLALAPTTATLTVTAPATPVTVGDTAVFTVQTNIHDHPISVTASGGATLSVCSGTASLSSGTLTVGGTDATATETIELCTPVASATNISVTASSVAPTLDHIVWVQSVGAVDPCQVFATFPEDDAVSTASSATVVAASATTTTTTTSTTTSTSTSMAPTTTAPGTPTTNATASTIAPRSSTTITGTDTRRASGSSVPNELAATGSSSRDLTGVGIAMMVAGALAVVARRRLQITR